MSKSTINAPAQRHWNRNPVGSQRSESAPGTARYFEDIRAYRYGYETPFLPEFFRYAQLAGQRVLEIGVGNGIDAVEMAKSGAIYSGIDVTARHIDLTRTHFELAGLPAPQLVCDDFLEYSFAEPFDAVYSFGVLHHIPREREYLARARDALKPGGRLLAGFYASFSSFNAYMYATWRLRAPAGTTYDDWRSHIAEHSLLGEPVTIRIRSRRELQSLVESQGFEVVRYAKRGFTQGHLPLLGRFCAPDGAVLTNLGRLFGWYHLFEFRKVI